jgi:hypothetical protein
MNLEDVIIDLRGEIEDLCYEIHTTIDMDSDLWDSVKLDMQKVRDDLEDILIYVLATKGLRHDYV